MRRARRAVPAAPQQRARSGVTERGVKAPPPRRSAVMASTASASVLNRQQREWLAPDVVRHDEHPSASAGFNEAAALPLGPLAQQHDVHHHRPGVGAADTQGGRLERHAYASQHSVARALRIALFARS